MRYRVCCSFSLSTYLQLCLHLLRVLLWNLQIEAMSLLVRVGLWQKCGYYMVLVLPNYLSMFTILMCTSYGKGSSRHLIYLFQIWNRTQIYCKSAKYTYCRLPNHFFFFLHFLDVFIYGYIFFFRISIQEFKLFKILML